jgi:hypothetical protein
MKSFLVSLIITLMFILPNVVQADTLDDFKNILTGKHFFIKYTSSYDAEVAVNESAYDQHYELMMREIHHSSGVYVEMCEGDNFYSEKRWKFNPNVDKKYIRRINRDISTPCRLKIGNKLFSFSRTENNNIPSYFTQFSSVRRNKKIVYYVDVDEKFNFNNPSIRTALSPAIGALINEVEDIASEKYLYRRAGNGTTEDGLEYFDLKAETGLGGNLNALRYCFDNGIIKKIFIAAYYKDPQTGEITGNRTVIDVEEFNTNPEPKYFRLPENFTTIEKSYSPY